MPASRTQPAESEVGHMVILKPELKGCGMERFVGVEEARSTLGRLAEDVAAGDEVWLTKRGRPLAVLVGRDEFDRLRAAASRAQRAELTQRLADVRRLVTDAGLDPQVIDEALMAARSRG